MTPQDELVREREADWRELERLLDGRLDTGASASRMAALYRALCGDLARAEAARVTPALLARLDALAGRAHTALYRAEPMRLRSIWHLLVTDFPRTLRAEHRFLWAAVLLFALPCAFGYVSSVQSPTFAEEILPKGQLERMVEMYRGGVGHGRGSGEGMEMTGFYVMNNVGIAFRTFATGALFGTGSVFFLFYNGLIIGTTAGYVVGQGHTSILTFMVGHGALELTAILIAGAAGLRLGWAMVAPGGLTRGASLRAAARPIAVLVFGAAWMLLGAALLEAFWSPAALPDPVKWSAGAALWTLVVAYLVFAGRGAKA